MGVIGIWVAMGFDWMLRSVIYILSGLRVEDGRNFMLFRFDKKKYLEKVRNILMRTIKEKLWRLFMLT